MFRGYRGSVAEMFRVPRHFQLPPGGTYLVKLGHRQHISNFYERVELRIAPSAYADPSLNSAIRDDELALSAFGQQSEVLIRAFDQAGALRLATRPIGNLTDTSRSKTNYYVQCMATRLDARLFADSDMTPASSTMITRSLSGAWSRPWNHDCPDGSAGQARSRPV